MTSERSYLTVLFDHFPVGVMVADDRGYYVDANQAACELLGRRRDEIVGQHLSVIVAPGRMAEVDVQWRSFLRDGSQRGVFEVMHADGTVRRVQFNARAHFVAGLHCSFLSPVDAGETVPPAAPDNLLTVCAWSKRVRYEGAWISLEQYLMLAHGKFVTHGMSPEAFTESKPKAP